MRRIVGTRDYRVELGVKTGNTEAMVERGLRMRFGRGADPESRFFAALRMTIPSEAASEKTEAGRGAGLRRMTGRNRERSGRQTEHLLLGLLGGRRLVRGGAAAVALAGVLALAAVVAGAATALAFAGILALAIVLGRIGSLGGRTGLVFRGEGSGGKRTGVETGDGGGSDEETRGFIHVDWFLGLRSGAARHFADSVD
jgi:hypothetical protein